MGNKIDLVGILCVASLALSTSLSAQTTPRKSSSPAVSPKTAASPAASAVKQNTRPLPFHGMISGVDQNAKTFTIAGKKESRVFKVTDKTAITKAGKTATMQDITDNEEASGSYFKNADGTLEAKMIKIGPVSTKEAKSSPAPVASPAASPKP
jgi:20S proteasome alpha/beta subunit